MGEVYRARDQRLGRDVAVKVLPDHLSKDAQALARFEREARSLAALSHNNILTIYDFGTDQGVSFAVMELLKGQTLRALLAQSKLGWNRAIEIGVAVGEGLAAAHSAGVIHRDLKPDNIFITSDGRIRILDFGLARWVETTEAQHQTDMPTVTATDRGVVAGTVPYMSPEQLRGESLDNRSDIFSFGCVLYEMVTGKRPFQGKTQVDTISAILKEEPPDLSSVAAVPPSLQETVSRCLKKNAAERFQTANDLVFSLNMISRESVTAGGSSRATTNRLSARTWSPFWILAAVVVLVTVALLYFKFILRAKPVLSVAVLPFANTQHNPNLEYLTDGIPESIIGAVSQIPGLRVMARGTVFNWKGKDVDPRKVGEELNVEAVVTGSITQQGDNLVIRADLVKATDGTEMWGDNYIRKSSDLLALQEEIAQRISENLQVKLTGEVKNLIAKRYPENSEAYQLYLRGRYYWNKSTSEDYAKSIESYQQAIQKDPKYALAYSGLADTYHSMTTEGLLRPKEGFQKVESTATTALRLDSSLAEAHASLATVRFAYDWNWKAAEEEVQRAVSLDPNCLECHHFYARYLRAMGRFDEAVDEAKKALALDPLSIEINVTLGTVYYWAGRYDQAIAQYQKTLELDSKYPDVHDNLADAYAKKQMSKEALAQEQEFLRLEGDEEGADILGRDYEEHGFAEARRLLYENSLSVYQDMAKEQYVSPMTFGTIYTLLGERDQAFAWLDKAYEERSIFLVFLKTDPQYDNLRRDPRFAALLKRIGFPG